MKVVRVTNLGGTPGGKKGSPDTTKKEDVLKDIARRLFLGDSISIHIESHKGKDDIVIFSHGGAEGRVSRKVRIF